MVEPSTPNSSNIHAGHRARIKQRIDINGFSPLLDHELLEYLLYPVLPRRNTNPIAHSLLNTFGSFDRVLAAPVCELCNISGIGRDTARYIRAISEANSRYYLAQVTAEHNRKLETIQDLFNYAWPYFIGCQTECLYLMSLSNSSRVLDMSLISQGSVNQNVPDLRKLTQIVLNCNASCAVVFHNHPDGSANPSKMDVNWTRDLEAFLRRIGVILVDHIIISGTSYFSLYARSFQTVSAPIPAPDEKSLSSRFPPYEIYCSAFEEKSSLE